MIAMKITTIKLRNNSTKTYNGVKPGQCVNVEDPTPYFVNWFIAVAFGEAEENEEDSYENMTVAQLKSLCQERWIEADSKTKKADLISLLEAQDSGKVEENEGEEIEEEITDEDLLKHLN